MQHGMGSTTFALAVALSSIVMYDAAGVRRHAGACPVAAAPQMPRGCDPARQTGLPAHLLRNAAQRSPHPAAPSACAGGRHRAPGAPAAAPGPRTHTHLRTPLPDSAGKHAEVLNHVLSELLEGHPISQVQLKEVLGHTPLQVRRGSCSTRWLGGRAVLSMSGTAPARAPATPAARGLRCGRVQRPPSPPVPCCRPPGVRWRHAGHCGGLLLPVPPFRAHPHGGALEGRGGVAAGAHIPN